MGKRSLVFFVGMAFALAAHSSEGLLATTEGVRNRNIRKEASVDGAITGTLPPGSLLAVRREGGWLQILSGPFAGHFISAERTKLTQEPYVLAKVTAERGARARSLPSPRSRILGTLPNGYVVAVSPGQEGWFRVVEGKWKGAYLADSVLLMEEAKPQESQAPQAVPVETKIEPVVSSPRVPRGHRLGLALGRAESAGNVRAEVRGGFFLSVGYEGPPRENLRGLRVLGELSWLELSQGQKMVRYVRPQAGAALPVVSRMRAGLLYGVGPIRVRGARSEGSAFTQDAELRLTYEIPWGGFFIRPRVHANYVLDKVESFFLMGFGLSVARAFW